MSTERLPPAQHWGRSRLEDVQTAALWRRHFQARVWCLGDSTTKQVDKQCEMGIHTVPKSKHAGSQFPDQGSSPHFLQREDEVLTLDHQGSPETFLF